MFKKILDQIRSCSTCQPHLPHEVNPVIHVGKSSKIVIIGQAPGSKVHQTSIAWNDPSGDRLRDWLDIDKTLFYDAHQIGLIPMGFCYPGKGKTGDLPPRKECAPQWHAKLFDELKHVQLVVLVGSYAVDYYLKETKQRTLTTTIEHFEQYLPKFLVLPHPSPRNNIWLKKNPWFETHNIPMYKEIVEKALLT